MVLPVYLRHGRTGIGFIAEIGCFPDNAACEFVVGNGTRIRSLGQHNEQIIVNKGALGNSPYRKTTTAEVRPDVLIPYRFVCVYVDAIEIAIVTARIDVIAVDGRYASRAGKRNTPGSVVGEIPEFLAIGKVKTPEVITDFVIAIEEIDLAVFDNRSGITPADVDSPQDLRPALRPRT